MYERACTVIRTNEFNVKVGVHQELVSSPIQIVVVMEILALYLKDSLLWE